ncbi:NAD-dependent epimerase/dehydratase family protein [Opitutus sp. GAS368]|uniref:NAD-dependent epimerase/dehydratase family protein n=1 Tax=Opitutus sp. GAS368 TaxID=1882749 RepID=UPI000879ECC8|nr:NAD-dependent epimerase/dehydratase family protein [Opitutus sp. GAS368]SDS08606.1 dTDP-glucose 4,6-dehydratase [Opitutus sp. GAS368]
MPAPLPPLPAEDLDHVLAHTGQLWVGARGATIFVTGGTGFFGTWLLESFVRANDTLGLGMRATVLTRDPAAFARKAPHLAGRSDLAFHQGELRTFAFPAGRFTHLIHAAADTGVWTKNESPAGLIERIATGMRHLLDFAAGAGIKNFLHVSSGAVYGPQPAALTHVPEDYPGITDPLPAGAAWAEGKRVAEQLCLAHAAQHGYALKIARCFAFVGPHLDENYAMGNFIGDALHGRPIQVKGDGTPHRSYLYASDLAIWLWTLLFAGAPGRAYNVGSPDDLSIAETARTVAAAAGESLPVKIAETPAPGRPLSRYVPSVERAEIELGLRAWIPLNEAVRKTLAWQRSAKAVLSS